MDKRRDIVEGSAWIRWNYIREWIHEASVQRIRIDGVDLKIKNERKGNIV